MLSFRLLQPSYCDAYVKFGELDANRLQYMTHLQFEGEAILTGLEMCRPRCKSTSFYAARRELTYMQ